MQDPISVLLADDHPVVLDGLALLLSEYPEVKIVGKAKNGKEAVDLVLSNRVDVVLLDIEMPVLNGWEVLQIIKRDKPDVKVIAFTIYSGAEVFKMLDAGVDGYLLKSSPNDEVVKAIKIVHRGENYFSADITQQLLDKQKAAKEVNLILSKREIEIAVLISQGHISAGIAAKLFISPATVDTHRKNIMAKLEVKNVAGLVHYVLKNNLS